MTSVLKPICIDLDGTLIRSDLTFRVLRIYMGSNFLNIFKILFWFLRGRGYLKHKLANRVEIDVSSLDYNKELLDFIAKKKIEGHKIFLATACNKNYADKVADFLGVFDGVFASDRFVNLRAEAKARTLVAIFGSRGFIYAGNSNDDLKVFNKSAESILVAPSRAILKKMRGRKYLLFK